MVGDGSFNFLLKFINEGYFLMVFYEIGGQLQTIIFVYFFFIDVLLQPFQVQFSFGKLQLYLLNVIFYFFQLFLYYFLILFKNTHLFSLNLLSQFLESFFKVICIFYHFLHHESSKMTQFLALFFKIVNTLLQRSTSIGQYILKKCKRLPDLPNFMISMLSTEVLLNRKNIIQAVHTNQLLSFPLFILKTCLPHQLISQHNRQIGHTVTNFTNNLYLINKHLPLLVFSDFHPQTFKTDFISAVQGNCYVGIFLAGRALFGVTSKHFQNTKYYTINTSPSVWPAQYSIDTIFSCPFSSSCPVILLVSFLQPQC